MQPEGKKGARSNSKNARSKTSSSVERIKSRGKKKKVRRERPVDNENDESIEAIKEMEESGYILAISQNEDNPYGASIRAS